MNDLDDFYYKRWNNTKDWLNVGRSRLQRFNNFLKLTETYHLDFKNKACIDYGCGSAWFSYYLYQKKYKNLYAFDVTPSSLKIVDKEYPFFKKIYGLEHESSSSIESSYFDLCVSSEVYEHVEFKNKTQFIEELARILKQNGYLYLTTPNGKYKATGITEDNFQPVEDWDRPEIVASLLKKSGFKIVDQGSFFLSSKLSKFHKIFLGYKFTKFLKLLNLDIWVSRYFEKNMYGLSTYFLCKKL